ncbi:MAG: SMC-Scp complex subunit ScpB [Firmicutes bacterium]|nr:SMC-Scp complex subunit ScpB [Bacillota bacterium]
MDQREIKSIIESLLFIWGEPLSIKDISKVIQRDKIETEQIIKDMKDDFDYNRRGLQIIQINDSFQLSTRPEHYEWIEKLCLPKNSKTLSNAALETLSIIAYKQPITRVEVESVRGVKCDKSITTLIEKNMVKEVGRLDKTGRPIIYGTTEYFLKYFGLENLEELPKIKELNEINKEENNTV